MKRLILIVAGALALATNIFAKDKNYQLQSPSGDVKVTITAGEELK